MDKKIYQKPTMKVVLLKQRAQLLVGSINATRSAYADPTELEWGE